MLKKWFQKFSNFDAGTTPLTLTELRQYVSGQDPAHPPTEAMLIDVLKRILQREQPSEDFPKGKRYVDKADNDVRIKKLLELALTVAKSNQVGIESVAMLLEFIDIYDDIIKSYDSRHKEIYGNRLIEQTKAAIATVEAKIHLHDKYTLIHSKTPSNP